MRVLLTDVANRGKLRGEQCSEWAEVRMDVPVRMG